MNNKTKILKFVYFAIMILWVLQIAYFGFNVMTIIPTVCLVISYLAWKKSERENGG